MNNATIIEEFYTAFTNRDAAKMTSLYADDVIFSDPAFGTLKGEKAKNMWRMLLSNKGETKMSFRDVKGGENEGSAHWTAKYTFSQTGNKVVNEVDAKFKIKDGKIIEHHDDFNLHTWAKQAFGFKGRLIGGTGFFRKKLQASTNELLNKFEAKQS